MTRWSRARGEAAVVGYGLSPIARHVPRPLGALAVDAARAAVADAGLGMDAEDYLAAPMVNDPVRRLDCDLPVDGVAAFVLTTAERAKDLPHRPVHVAGYALAQPPVGRLPMHWPLDDILTAGGVCARRMDNRRTDGRRRTPAGAASHRHWRAPDTDSPGSEGAT